PSSTSLSHRSCAPRGLHSFPTRRSSDLKVLLLGGPNTYLPFLQQAWRLRIPETWDEREYDYPKDVPLDEIIVVPDNAQYYAAFGDRKSTRLNSSHVKISYAVFCLKKKTS